MTSMRTIIAAFVITVKKSFLAVIALTALHKPVHFLSIEAVIRYWIENGKYTF